ncbi:MAG: 50S ribosomal protein L37ae [Candidatus Aenigmatarchaeota archaeon]
MGETTGRFGSRYGKGVKKRVAEIEKVQKQRHICPSCSMRYVKRIGPGIWECKKCGTKFAGAAYVPKAEMIKKEVK